MEDIALAVFEWVWFVALIALIVVAIYLFVKLLRYCFIGRAEELAYAGRFYDEGAECFRLKPDKSQLQDILTLVGIYLGYRVVSLGLVYAIKAIFEPGFSFSFDRILYEIIKWDANHYVGIADNWYVTEGDARFHIVFYPLHPIVVRVFSYICPNTKLASVLVSNISFIGCIAAMYKLLRIDFSRDTAKTAVLMLIFVPHGFFFSFGFTESLFLLWSLLFFLMLRKEQWVAAGAFGFCAALTKNFGLVFVVPYGVWLIMLACKNKYRVWGFIRRLLPGFLILAGFGVYLLINKAVTGDWFKFMEYQRDHWYNRLTCPLENVTNHLYWFFDTQNMGHRWFLWFGNISSIAVTAAIFFIGAKKQPFIYSIYTLACLFLTMMVSWLMSGPRYLLVCFSSYITLAAVSKGRPWLKWAIIAVEIILGMIVLLGYMGNESIM